MAKFLQGYGFRVQKSAFEAMISLPLYHKLMREIRAFISEEDSIRIYKIIGQGQVTVLGKMINQKMMIVLLSRRGEKYGKNTFFPNRGIGSN